jgi:hypothetical protein
VQNGGAVIDTNVLLFTGVEGLAAYYQKWLLEFPIVMEVGTHQHAPSSQEIQSEVQRTYKGVLYFIREAPLVIIHPEECQFLMMKKIKIPFIRSFGILKQIKRNQVCTNSFFYIFKSKRGIL